eukprot:GILJ01028970.1.p1 GENE.GILJ01028970.1~~GILJ01028970.1.p1  ORF type:complete len:223 (-),score=30.50 GILJ01028970.1:101-769(-)
MITVKQLRTEMERRMFTDERCPMRLCGKWFYEKDGAVPSSPKLMVEITPEIEAGTIALLGKALQTVFLEGPYSSSPENLARMLAYSAVEDRNAQKQRQEELSAIFNAVNQLKEQHSASTRELKHSLAAITAENAKQAATIAEQQKLMDSILAKVGVMSNVILQGFPQPSPSSNQPTKNPFAAYEVRNLTTGISTFSQQTTIPNPFSQVASPKTSAAEKVATK